MANEFEARVLRAIKTVDALQRGGLGKNKETAISMLALAHAIAVDPDGNEPPWPEYFAAAEEQFEKWANPEEARV